MTFFDSGILLHLPSLCSCPTPATTNRAEFENASALMYPGIGSCAISYTAHTHTYRNTLHVSKNRIITGILSHVSPCMRLEKDNVNVCALLFLCVCVRECICLCICVKVCV